MEFFKQETIAITKIDYETEMELMEDKEKVILRMCNAGELPGQKTIQNRNLAFLAINSTFVFYTKLMFIKYDES